MTEKKPLFDKPIDELRKAFVRARFGQKNVFGREDIEVWLSSQYHSEPGESVPDRSETGFGVFMLELVSSLKGADLVEGLSVYAGIWLDDIWRARSREAAGEDMFFIQGILLAQPYSTFCAFEETGPIIILQSESQDKRLAFYFKDNTMSPVDEEVVIDAIFAKWRNKNFEKAKDFVYEACKKMIEQERKKAEDDFDRAVAVNADGTKIVHADEVLVINGHSQLLVFPAEVFRQNKISRAGMLYEHYPEYSSADWNEAKTCAREGYNVYGWLYKHWLKRRADFNISHFIAYLHPDLFDGKTRFITQLEFCPRPLPEGGVEVPIIRIDK